MFTHKVLTRLEGSFKQVVFTHKVLTRLVGRFKQVVFTHKVLTRLEDRFKQVVFTHKDYKLGQDISVVSIYTYIHQTLSLIPLKEKGLTPLNSWLSL